MQCEPPRRRDIGCNPLLSAYGMYSTVLLFGAALTAQICWFFVILTNA